MDYSKRGERSICLSFVFHSQNIDLTAQYNQIIVNTPMFIEIIVIIVGLIKNCYSALTACTLVTPRTQIPKAAVLYGAYYAELISLTVDQEMHIT